MGMGEGRNQTRDLLISAIRDDTRLLHVSFIIKKAVKPAGLSLVHTIILAVCKDGLCDPD